MKYIGYLEESEKWVKSYHLSMPDWDKSLISNIFKIISEVNTECIIYVATNTYSMGIENLDIRLVISKTYLSALI